MISIPPFPPLEWDTYSWLGEVVLSSWAGFQTRRSSYGATSSQDESDGSAELHVAAIDKKKRTPPSPEQCSAFQFLLDNEQAVTNAILREIFRRYPEEQKAYGYSRKEAAKYMPNLTSADQLRLLIGLGHVHMLNVAKDGLAYIGFQIGCKWDDDHGVGVMTHRDRIVRVGGADTSFLEWIAQEDAKAK